MQLPRMKLPTRYLPHFALALLLLALWIRTIVIPDISTPKQPNRILQLYKTASQHSAEDRNAEAYREFSEMLKLALARDGNLSKAVASAQLMLGNTAMKLEENELAEKHYLEYIKISLKGEEVKSSDEFVAHYALGMIRSKKKDFQGALVAYQEALNLAEAMPVPDLRAIGVLKGNLGSVYNDLSQRDVGDSLIKDGIAMLRKILETNDDSIVTSNLRDGLILQSSSFMKQKRWLEAEPVAREAIVLTEIVGGKSSPELPWLKSDMEKILTATGRKGEIRAARKREHRRWNQQKGDY